MPSASYDRAPFNMPTRLAFAPNGDIFVADGYGAHLVHRFSPEGELQLSWGKEGDGPGEFVNLHSVAVDKRDRVYICDRENHRIQLFDMSGGFLEQWPDMQSPNDLSIQGDVIYVCAGGGVSIRTLDGKVVTSWTGNEGPLRGINIGGHGIWVDAQGSIYLGGAKATKFQRV